MINKNLSILVYLLFVIVPRHFNWSDDNTDYLSG